MYTQFDHFSADTLVDIPNDTLNISFEKHIEYDESEWITFEEINSQQDEEMEEDEVQFSKQEQAIMDKQAAEVGKHLERYLRKSIPINVPKLGTSSSSEVVYPQNAEIESKLFGQGYFKLGTKVTLDENELKKTNQVRETDKFIAQNSIIQNIEKRELAPTLKVEKLKKKETAGKGWFDMEAPIMTPELEQELIALQLRHATRGASKTKLEPQQQELPKFFQVCIHSFIRLRKSIDWNCN